MTNLSTLEEIAHLRYENARMLAPKKASVVPPADLGCVASVRITMAKEDSVPWDRARQITGPRDSYDLVSKFLDGEDRENVVVLGLNTKHCVVLIHRVAAGSVASCPARIAEILRAAIIANCPAIIVAHNHPSGDPYPSTDDVVLTKRIVEAGDLLGIEVLDHVVIGDGQFVSMRERGMGFSR